MVDKAYFLEILTPEKVIFKGEVISLVIPAYEGYLGVLKDHAPLISILKAGTIEIKATNLLKRFRITTGYLKVFKNNVTILGEKIEEVIDE